MKRVIELPELHPGQRRIRRAMKRFNVARMGRRWGKTTFGLDYLVGGEEGERGLAAGFPCGWFAPTHKVLADGWRESKAILSPIIVAKEERDHRLELATGGSLEFWTLDIDDPARGRKYGRIFVDEAAQVRNLKDKWEQAIRPTLTDYRGEALFGSTPKGKNFFHELDQRSLTRENWASFHAPSHENPHLPADELEEARGDLPELVYRQEYLGEYVDFAGVVVRPEFLQHGLPEGEFPIVIGVDLAISLKDEAAYTAMVAMCRDRPLGRVFILGALRFRATFNTIVEQIIAFAASISAEFGGRAVTVLVEEVQFQAAVVQELLRRSKLIVRGVRPDKDKLTRFLPLAARYEQRMVYHAPTLPAYFAQEILALPVPDFWDQIDASSIAYAGLPASTAAVASAGRRTF
ncbi:MAG: hypothetical protein IPP91_11230 [Betaproteobacteria bacterium]|nr:hypothetical protein [Betaproteobacteria bacterium]